MERSQGVLVYIAFLSLWEMFESFEFFICPHFKTLAYFSNSDERIINVLIYGLSSALFGYYEGIQCMMKPL